ncbi:MAG: hypothetical protein RLZZ210_1484 [Pseudomonadota bacterium]|jgi:hypothetical protein
MSEYIVNNIDKEESSLNIHAMYCKYHYDCLQRNYKILNLSDFTVYINFIQDKINFIQNKLKELIDTDTKPSAKYFSMQDKLNKVQFLAKNPNYEIEFVTPVLIELEREVGIAKVM